MECKICGSHSHKIFEALVLNKYNACYYQCGECKFIQTEDPYWLPESYTSAITSLDIGLLQRNIEQANITSLCIRKFFDRHGKFLDFGGGYGIFTRLLRDKGIDCYRQDKYCENLFARYFDITDAPQPHRFELLTAFEVFEHLADPLKEINDMFRLSDNILFSTILQPGDDLTPGNWWYISPEIGQHISFYHPATLNKIAEKYNCFIYSNGKNMHLLTKRKISSRRFNWYTNPAVVNILSALFPAKTSLLSSDYERIKKTVYPHPGMS